MAEEKKQINVDFTNFPDLLEGLDQMVEEDGTDRSKFIRKLVRQELSRRQSPTPIAQPKRRKTDLRPADTHAAVVAA
jgi:metal-responsive CopG/Arc/MetJ family transcriptional regulator